MAKPNKQQTESGGESGGETARDLSDFRVKYTGPEVHRRVLRARDFGAAGIDDVTQKVWSRDGNHVVDFSEYEGDKTVLATFFEQPALAGEFTILAKGEL